MADVSETETLLRQIKFLSDLINNAKQKEKKVEKGKKSSSFSPVQVSKRQTSSGQTCKQKGFETGSLSQTFPSTSTGSVSPSHHLSISSKSQTRTRFDLKSLPQDDKDQQQRRVILTGTQRSISEPPRYMERKATPKNNTQHRQLAQLSATTKGNNSTNNKQVSVKKRSSQSFSDRSEAPQARVNVNQLTQKKAEVSLARKMMKDKIENLKASIAQLSEAKKQKSVCKQISAEKQVPVPTDKQISTGEKASRHFVKDKAQEIEQKTENARPGNVETAPSRVELVSLPSTSLNLSNKETETPCNRCPNFSRKVCQQPESVKAKITTSRDLSEENLKTKYEEQSKTAKCTVLNKSSAVTELEKELFKTEKKLRCMRQKIGCMLKESPTKSADTSHSLLAGDLIHRDAHSSQEKHCCSPSHQKRPFPNRKSLKWTPQKCRTSRTNAELVVSSSLSHRSLKTLKKKSSTPKSTAFHHVALAGTRNTPASTVQSSTINTSQCHFTKIHAKTKKMSPVVSETSNKVQTTRCLFGKYSLRNVKTSTPSPQTVEQPARIVKSRFKVVRNSGLAGQSVAPRSTETQSVVQRAAKLVVGKYKMQRVPVSLLPSKLHLLYQRQSPAHLRNCFPTKTNVNYNYRQWKYGKCSGSLYGRSNAKLTLRQYQCRWWTNGGSRHLQHAAALQRRKTAMALKSKMSWTRTQPHYRYSRQVGTTNGQEHLQKRLRLIKKYKLLKWRKPNQQDASPNKRATDRQDRLLMINGILYRSSNTHLAKASKFSPNRTVAQKSVVASAVVVKNVSRKKMHTVTVRGVRFRVDGQGTKLQRVSSTSTSQDKATISRVDLGGTTYIQTKEGTLEKVFDNQTKTVINRVKQRSIALAAAKFKKDNIKERKKLCLFFSRFGRCSRGDKCPFTHDPDKVAVCTRFLRGTCKVEQCPFSHQVAKEKMPVCAFFLRGVCAREPCPYLHVKVDQGAEVCQDFVRGFCSLADKCKKLHTLTCPSFSKTGACPDGKKCRLQHRKDSKTGTKKNQRVDVLSESAAQTSRQAVKRRHSAEVQDERDNCQSARKLSRLPAFISLADYSTDESPAQTPSQSLRRKQKPRGSGISMQIKPRL